MKRLPTCLIEDRDRKMQKRADACMPKLGDKQRRRLATEIEDEGVIWGTDKARSGL
jgi:hypothetical protein